MNRTLRISFSLRNTYRVNCILYSLKQVPFIKKLIPGSFYDKSWLKGLANILSGLWEIFMAMAGKLVYFLFLYFTLPGVDKIQDNGRVFLHILIFLTIIGSFSNTFLFNPTKDKYYAMILMRMNAKAYTLVNYGYALLKILVGFSLFGIWVGRKVGLPLWQCVLIPLFVVGIKMLVAAYYLRDFEKKGIATDENKLGIWSWGVILLLLGIAYGLPALELELPAWISLLFMGACILGGAFSLGKILTFDYYQEIYRQLFANSFIHENMRNVMVQEQKQQSRNSISENLEITSEREGFEYLNELFIRRHHKILWRTAKIYAVAGVVLLLGILVAFWVKPSFKAPANEALPVLLPYFLFIMYAFNRGADFTRILFINCDHSLLTYSFYKQSRHILQLYQIRLRELIRINLLPASVIAVGLAVLLWASGGTDNVMNYVVLVVSILFMSVLFSVHHLTVYYLLQPYNAETEVKSATYQIITAITGLACYIIMQLKLPIMVFGLVIIAFCVLYCVVASVLVYRLAPGTFRIRA